MCASLCPSGHTVQCSKGSASPCTAQLSQRHTITQAAVQTRNIAAAAAESSSAAHEVAVTSVDPQQAHIGVLGGGQLGRMMALAAVRYLPHAHP